MEGDGEGDEEAQRKVAVQRLLDLASKSKDSATLFSLQALLT